MKILLVDDSSIVRKKFEKLLTHLGYTVIAAESGSAGWEILRKTGDLQLAIVDWEMPQMSGVEMCRIVRESKLGRYIYFVLLTANSGAEYIVKGMQAGADDYLTKSVSEEELAVRLSAGCRIVELHKELEQRSKLESIGTLAAGVAHELNTPIQYVRDNTSFFRDEFGKLVDLLQAYRTLAAKESVVASASDEVQALQAQEKDLDLEYILAEIPVAIQQTLEGADTVAEIVRAMKVFSHPGSEGKTSVDLNEALRGTATVSRSEWKNLADIIFELDQELPAVECFASELNQVFLNVVVNAAHAIEEKNQGKGTITVKTYTKNDKVCVSIEDTGSGVPEEIRDSIFDPFFTTKEVGKGTGQGLSVAYNIITQRHAGKIDFKSTVGEGTTFVIELPRNSNAQV